VCGPAVRVHAASRHVAWYPAIRGRRRRPLGGSNDSGHSRMIPSTGPTPQQISEELRRQGVVIGRDATCGDAFPPQRCQPGCIPARRKLRWLWGYATGVSWATGSRNPEENFSPSSGKRSCVRRRAEGSRDPPTPRQTASGSRPHVSRQYPTSYSDAEYVLAVRATRST
jgi:hypothetical protein